MHLYMSEISHISYIFSRGILRIKKNSEFYNDRAFRNLSVKTFASLLSFHKVNQI